MEHAGPSKRSIPAVSLALLPTTRCRSLHWRVSRSFWRGRFGCAAAPAVSMPESDLEMTAMLSQAAERVGLEWRKPPCPEPSRLDDWFLGVACAGSQRPAPGASLPEVHEELTGRGRQLLQAETDLLTPPTSPPSVVREEHPAYSSTWFPELMLLVTAPFWQIPLRKDLLTQRRGTMWHPRPDLGKLHVWSLDGTRRF